MKRILVTGSAGFVGSHLCERLLSEGKRCAETLFMDYHRQNRVRIKIARIFNTYGTRMQPNDGQVVSNFIIQALQNYPFMLSFGVNKDCTKFFCTFAI